MYKLYMRVYKLVRIEMIGIIKGDGDGWEAQVYGDCGLGEGEA